MADGVIQGSDEWHQLRIGRVTASRIADLMSKTKSGWGASRHKYMIQLIAERLTGQPTAGFTSAAMQWGTDTEPMARTAYEFMLDCTVDQVGFIVHPKISESGASPDGLVDADGMIEIKCPGTHAHIETITSGNIDSNYIKQMQWQMECAGKDWCDFISFDPRLPAQYQIWVRRVERDVEMAAQIREAVTAFLSELQDKLDNLQAAA